jgi:hypothetical protein
MPFRTGKNDQESSGSRHWLLAETNCAAAPCSAPRAPHDRVYVRVRMARRLYAHNRAMPWPDANLPARWHLNSRRVSVPPVPREGPERFLEIMRR